jgi:hypothetical protein
MKTLTPSHLNIKGFLLLTLLLSGCGPCGLEGSSKVRRKSQGRDGSNNDRGRINTRIVPTVFTRLSFGRKGASIPAEIRFRCRSCAVGRFVDGSKRDVSKRLMKPLCVLERTALATQSSLFNRWLRLSLGLQFGNFQHKTCGNWRGRVLFDVLLICGNG